MSLRSPEPRISEAEYLALEQASEQRHEWFGGQIYAMASGRTATTCCAPT
jgi:hypothetical protein